MKARGGCVLGSVLLSIACCTAVQCGRLEVMSSIVFEASFSAPGSGDMLLNLAAQRQFLLAYLAH